eukprot:TRINITY_DN747_c0_g1_i1.p1 TRINITY_DN747_c0_g1~~TRINITY_DN747_c0_g1_i1.p1  ORF type:complete len:525 (-),score=150.03 TRINITY_DN747_c0_g1_i1:59-1441(-)
MQRLPPHRKVKLACKVEAEYSQVKSMPLPSHQVKLQVQHLSQQARHRDAEEADEVPHIEGPHAHPAHPGVALSESSAADVSISAESMAEVMKDIENARQPRASTASGLADYNVDNSMALTKVTPAVFKAELDKPEWHAPWKLYRVIAGHLGWVRAICVDPANEWFATGSADRTVKIWDLATGQLKLTLTGHINTVRALAVSAKYPYLFSCGEDKMVKCWDLECNKVIRHYHGHLSGVYSMSLHPTLDVLVTGGRDSVLRVWDIRTKAQIHVLEGHNNTVGAIVAQGAEPQIVSGSMDSTVKFWDLAEGKCITTLTHHKKGVRGLALHPSEFTLCSAAADNLKKWRFPRGEFLGNFSGHRAVVNAVALSKDNVLVSAADNGSMYFWDWKTGYNFQQMQTKPQPGSLESEAGIYNVAFDQTSLRLFTCEADKSVKVWKMDEEATPETHPVKNWRRSKDRRKF